MRGEGNPELMRLNEALEAKGADYKPRTYHLNDDGSPKYVNRLILETSSWCRSTSRRISSSPAKTSCVSRARRFAT